MISVRKVMFAAAVALGVAGTETIASAQTGVYPQKYPTLGSALFANRHQPLPTFQAAPSYLYWPYDAHFQTPAPVVGPWYGPPIAGNYPVNPYFPPPQYGPYGPMPGGPAPGAPIGYGPAPGSGGPPAPAGYPVAPGGPYSQR